MKEPREPIEPEVNVDFGTNIGEVLKSHKLESETGKKIQKKETTMQDAKMILDSLSFRNDLVCTFRKTKSFINTIYSSKNAIDDKISYAAKLKDTTSLISFCWNVYISHDLHLQDNKNKLDQELKGI